jgi:hypothetical protein
MAAYNRRGIFSNQADDLVGLEHLLAATFAQYELDVHGCVAVFSAWAEQE